MSKSGITKQTLIRPALAVMSANRIFQDYQTKAAIYRGNPSADIFQEPGAFFYRTDNLAGRAASRLLIPKRYRKSELTEEEVQGLRQSGARHGKFGARIMMGANALNLAGNALALGSCWENGDCNAGDVLVMSNEVGGAASFFAFQHLMATALEHSRVANQAAAGSNFAAALFEQNAAGRLAYAARNFAATPAFGFKIVGGLIKAGREIGVAYEDPTQAKLSAILDGAIDVGDGASQIYLNMYYLAEYRKLKEAASATLSVAQRASDILTVNARVMPLKILLPRIGFGVATGIPTFLISAHSVYEGMTNDSLSAEARRKMKVSGALGMVSSAGLIGSAIFIWPAVAFVGPSCLVVGLTFLVAQTVYDNWDSWFAKGAAQGTEMIAANPVGQMPSPMFTLDLPTIFQLPKLQSYQ